MEEKRGDSKAHDDAAVVWLGIKDVARLLDLSPSRVYAMAAEGAIPSTRVMGRIRIPKAAFETWLARQAELALASVREAGTK